MCEPATIMAITAGVGALMGGAAVVQQRKAAKTQAAALSMANQTQADQIALAAGAELMDRSRAARRTAGEQRAAASESGINLGSNSFLAALQTTAFNEQFDNGLITHNASEQQQGRESEYSSRMASINVPTGLGVAFGAVQGGIQGYSMASGAISSGTQQGTGGQATAATKPKRK